VHTVDILVSNHMMPAVIKSLRDACGLHLLGIKLSAVCIAFVVCVAL
jgi:hypothetical protein